MTVLPFVKKILMRQRLVERARSAELELAALAVSSETFLGLLLV